MHHQVANGTHAFSTPLSPLIGHLHTPKNLQTQEERRLEREGGNNEDNFEEQAKIFQPT